MTSTAEDEEVVADLGGPRSVGQLLILWVKGFVVVALLYLVLAFAFPRSVPRLAVLPRPGPDRVWYDECQGQPGNRHDERWENDGLFWGRTESSTLAGCLGPDE